MYVYLVFLYFVFIFCHYFVFVCINKKALCDLNSANYILQFFSPWSLSIYSSIVLTVYRAYQFLNVDWYSRKIPPVKQKLQILQLLIVVCYEVLGM